MLNYQQLNIFFDLIIIHVSCKLFLISYWSCKYFCDSLLKWKLWEMISCIFNFYFWDSVIGPFLNARNSKTWGGQHGVLGTNVQLGFQQKMKITNPLTIYHIEIATNWYIGHINKIDSFKRQTCIAWYRKRNPRLDPLCSQI